MPTPVENLNPTSGIGVVVKKNPGSSAARLTANSDGTTFDLPDTMDPGNYDIVVSVPAHAISTKGTGAQNVRMSSTASKPATLTFHIIVSPRDPQSGLPTGARVHKPFTVTIDISRPPTVAVGSGTSSSQ